MRRHISRGFPAKRHTDHSDGPDRYMLCEGELFYIRDVSEVSGVHSEHDVSPGLFGWEITFLRMEFPRGIVSGRYNALFGRRSSGVNRPPSYVDPAQIKAIVEWDYRDDRNA